MAIDPTAALAAAYASQTFKDLSKKLLESVLSGVVRGTEKTYEIITRNFEPHLEATYNRCSKIKTLLSKEEPINLLAHYVELNFKCSDKLFDNWDAIEEVRKRKRSVISGTAGAGKTIFMKYLWLSFFQNPDGKIPIFVELRNLNDISYNNLLVYVFQTMVNTHANVTQGFFDSAVKSGKFVFMLDGFDEINLDKREIYEKQILALANDNPACTVIVSSRPDDRLQAWQLFSIFRVQPLQMAQVKALIEKIAFDPKVKSRFLTRLKKDLYKQHSEFLSNPLLATMMLMTFDQFADIPKKIHLFYEQAFDTLFARHDAVKEAFKRRMYSDLQSDRFKKYFSTFCLISYYEERFEFTEAELSDYLKRAFEYEQVKVDLNAFVRDLLESVCIMQRDGLKYVFSHRSFQEFFSAYGLLRMPSDKIRTLLRRLASRISDSVLLMLHDMNEDLVESTYVLPELVDLTEKLQRARRGDNFYAEFFEIMGIQVEISLADPPSQESFTFLNNKGYIFARQLEILYPAEVKQVFPARFSHREEPLTKFRKHLVEVGEIEESSGQLITVVSEVRDSHPLLVRYYVQPSGEPYGEGRPIDIDWFKTTRWAEACDKDVRNLPAFCGTVRKRVELRRKRLEDVFMLQ